MGDKEELRGEMQAVMSSVIGANDGELQACKAGNGAYETRVEALEAQIKVSMPTVGNSGGSVHVSTAPNGNTLRPLTFHGAKSAKEIDNFIWGLKT